MRDLGLEPPLSDVELVRLATELDLALVVTGEVRRLRLQTEGPGRFATVWLAVRVYDRIARCNVNGAVVEARGPTMVDGSEDELVAKALEQAAFEAVQEMKSRPTIIAMVLWASGETVFLNVGSRGGIRPGMRLVAVRGGERIGVVHVTDADALGAYARIAEGPPLRTGDSLRAIYELPKAPGRPSAVDIAEKKRGIEKLLLGAALLLGLGSFATRARLIDEGEIVAPQFAVSNLANGLETGYSGFSYSNFGTLHLLGSALVTWAGYQGTQSRQVVAYEIMRNNEMVDVVFLANQPENVYIDSPWPAGFRPVPWIPTEIDEETGEPSNPTWDEFVEDWLDEAGITVECTLVHYGWFPAGPFPGGLMPGGDYFYRVRPLILRQRQIAAGTFEWCLYRETELSIADDFLIGVAPPFARDYHWVFAGYQDGVYEMWNVLPNPEIIGNLATFFFYQPTGADEIVVQITRDPNIEFDPAGVHVEYVSVEPFAYEQEAEVDLTQVPGTGDVYWWRIGARNRRSTVAPRPYPTTLTNDFGYVWSERNSFSIAVAARTALMHERRDALLRARSAARTPARPSTERVLRAE
jgi:hypothetical protein